MLWGPIQPQAGVPRIAVAQGSPVRFLTNASDPGLSVVDWTAPEFDDSGWPSGTFVIGYDVSDEATDLLDTVVPIDLASIYTRASFHVSDPTAVEAVLLGADYDDGYVAWINGVEVFRSPELPVGELTWDSNAALHESSNGDIPDYGVMQDISVLAIPSLVAGENILATAVWNPNDGTSSSDLVLVPQLILEEPSRLTRAPYLQAGSPDSIRVRWRTGEPASSEVRYGPSPDNLTEQVTLAAAVTDHSVLLSGLTPDTRYYYEVRSDGQWLAGGDGDHYFTTAPPPGTPKPTRIWVLGDSGTKNDDARAVRDAYQSYSDAEAAPTDLWLMLGDNAYPDGTDTDYQLALFDMYPEVLRTAVLWPTLGNHDIVPGGSATQAGPYFDIFDLPTAGEFGGVASGTETYYSFDYANIHFIILNSNDSSRAPGSPMLTWLEADLSDTTQDWIIAYWHHPPYSKGSHDSDTDQRQIEMRQNVVSVLEDYGVDLVLNGHSHSYERSYFIDGHYDTSESFNDAMKVDLGDGRESGDGAYAKSSTRSQPHTGAVYTVAGSSGRISGGTLDHPAMLVSYNELGSVILTIAGNRLDLQFLNDQSVMRDEFTIIKGTEQVKPVADFVASPTSGASPLTVQFRDDSENVTTGWAWDFDMDGEVDSQLRNPEFSFDSPGWKTVRLIASNAAGDDEVVKPNLLCVAAALPTLTSGLVFDTRQDLSWLSGPAGSLYDVIRGDLGALRASGGDYAQSAATCLASETPTPQATDGSSLPTGAGYFYLARGVDCGLRAGSFDIEGQGLLASRDLALQLTPEACECNGPDDTDEDGVCGAFDNCPTVPSADLTDADGDGWGDACDACPLDAANDEDGDGVCGDVDNCVQQANPGQTDVDEDGLGDACDSCPTDALNDSDADGYCASQDNCPQLANPSQLDDDGDGLGNSCDVCPQDATNDTDEDGVCGGQDNCPAEFNPQQEDTDRDFLGDACDTCPLDSDNDIDSDFICGDVDNCPNVANFGQLDTDGDGIGDACDSDDDEDGVRDADDCAPIEASVTELPSPIEALTLAREGPATRLSWAASLQAFTANVYRGIHEIGAFEYDLECLATEVPRTTLLDAAAPASRQLFYYLVAGHNACGHSAVGAPSSGGVIPLPGCASLGADSDGDGVLDVADNCPLTSNADQTETDTDFVGDACDNCLGTFNPNQADADSNGVGDACDNPA